MPSEKIVKVFEIFVLIVVLIGCKAHSKEAMVEEGISLMKQGNPLGAVVFFNNALEKDPNYVEARYQLGLAYQKSGKLEKAEKEFQKVKLQDPANSQVLLDLAGLFLSLREVDKAESEIDQYLKNNPKNSLSREYQGRILVVRGDLPGAEEAFREAIDLDKNNISPCLYLTQLYIKLNWKDQTRSLLNSMVKIFPNDKRVYFLVATFETRQGNKKEALEAYRHILTIDPNDIGACFLTGIFLLDLGDKEGAQQVSNELEKRFPKHPAGMRLAGMISFSQGKFEDAEIKLREAVQGMPDLSGYYYLGLTEYRLGHYELALSQFQRALDIQAKHTPSRLMVAMVLLRQKRLDDAINEISKVLELDSENAMAYNILGSAYVAKGEYDKGMEYLDKASSIDPSLADVHMKKGLISVSMGNRDAAEVELAKAVEASPEVLNSRLLLASLYLREQKYDNAIKTLEEGLNDTEQDAILYNFVAAAFFAKKQKDKAIVALNNAKKVKPDYFTPYFNLANYYLSVGQRDKAVEEYQAVLKIDPKQVKALISLAALMEIQGNGAEAKAYYQAAREIGSVEGFLAEAGYLLRNKNKSAFAALIEDAYVAYPENPQILELRGKLLLEENKPDEAIDMFQKLNGLKPEAGLPLLIGAWLKIGEKEKAFSLAKQKINGSPESAYGYTLMSSIYQSQREIDQAESILKKGLENVNAKQRALLSYQLGALYAGSGRTDLAVKLLTDLRDSNPEFVSAIFTLGTIYDQSGDKKKAINFYREVLAKNENHVPSMNNLAYLYADNFGDPKEGLALAIKAFRSEPTNPAIMDTLGYVLLKNGRNEESVNILNKAAELLPKVAAVRLHQGEALLAVGRNVDARKALQAVLDVGPGPEAELARKLIKSIK